MNWITLNETAQLEEIQRKSNLRPQVIFKHSTRCGTSSLVKRRLERDEPDAGIDFYFLDLIHFRAVSNKIAEIFGIGHESPQLLLIKNGKCVYDESHLGIDMSELLNRVSLN
jgi:bacillithiol system protein YtxJ